MFRPISKKIASFLLSYLFVQLFITLWSLPILLSWGIPLSPLSFLGNLIFSPVLIIFLVLSSLIFFTEILGIHNAALIWCLEQLCYWWRSLLHSIKMTWSWSCVQPHTILLIFIPLLAIALCATKILTTQIQKTSALLVLLISIIIGFPLLYTPKTIIEKIESPTGPITLIYTNNTVTIIDTGALGSRVSALSWVEFTLIPTIAKKTGKTSIDHFITLRPTCITFQVLAELTTKITINNLYLPLWRDKIPYTAFKHFQNLKKKLDNTLIRISDKPLTITLSPTNSLAIMPSKKRIQLNGYSILEYHVHGLIDNQSVTASATKTKTLK